MWAIGIYDLGLSNEAFWALTLKQFSLLADRCTEQAKREDRRAGEVVAMLANVNRDSKKYPKGWTWLDIFPEWKEPAKPQTEEQMLEAMKMWAAATQRLAKA